MAKLERVGKLNRLSDQDIIRALEISMDETAKAMKVDYRVTVRTWDDKPTFTIKKINNRRAIIRIISTSHQNYLFVSEGTRPHKIRAKNAPQLAFRANYKRKSAYGKVASYKGGSYGPMVYAKEVNHPGTKAVKQPKTINKKWEREWPRQLDRALSVVAWGK